MKALTFKQLVLKISGVSTQDEVAEACGLISFAFTHGKISWNDDELLFQLLAKVSNGLK